LSTSYQLCQSGSVGACPPLTLNRLQKLRCIIAEKGLDALLVSQPENLRYLSGFTGSSGWLIISDTHGILATDFRYTEQAEKETTDFEVTEVKGELTHWLPQVIADLGWQRLGFEANYISFAIYQQLREAMKTKQLDLELIPTTGLVEHLRSIKEPGELEFIVKAVELVDAAFGKAESIIHPGMIEREAAWEIEKFLRQKGSEGMPFEIIVASGPNSALPHAKPTERVLHSGEPVLIDMGARINGYCSDFSRTLCLGKELKPASYQLSAIYDIVLEAQLTAIDKIESGIGGAEADHLARAIIEQAGYGNAFGHGLGHGVGLAVHESPTLGPNSSDLLTDGMVFTIEPGIYINGWGGVRIEDMVTMEKGKVRVLTKAKKDTCSAISFQQSAAY